MFRFKRLLSALLAMIMCFSMFPLASFATEPDGLDNFVKRNSFKPDIFTDVSESDWFYEDVKTAYELGLMLGKGENTFDTESGVTIAETITIAARIHSIYYTGSDAFDASTPWYKVYADYAVANGILRYDVREYTKPATRAEFVSILAYALPSEALEEINKVAADAIPDVKATDAYGAAAYKFYRAGIMIGNDEAGTFAPDSEIRRSEVAAISARMADKSLRKSVQLGNEYTVTFDMNGKGEQIPAQTVVEGYTAEKPADPSKATYVFKGWYTQKSGGSEYDFSTPVYSDVTLYARWEMDPVLKLLLIGMMNNENNGDNHTYTVTFDANGSGVTNLPASQTVKYGECAVIPHAPMRNGYVFAGWYLDKSGILVWDESTPIYSDTTIYASWYYAGIDQDDSEDKYKISDIIVDENEPIVNIEVTTQDECYLRLVITNDAQNEIIYDEKVSVHSDLWYERISVNVANLPEYFYIHAFLVDSNENELCDNYSSVLYSSYFAEFYEKDVDDFDSNLVLNFDNNSETNFSVAQDDVVIYELLSSQIVKNEKMITITGTNTPTFVIGQKYVIYDGESFYLCKPISVNQNGTETIILTDELPLTDYLSYIKIEEISYAYDTSSSSEQISTFARIDIIDIPGGDNKQTISAGFTVGNDEDDAEIELKADGYIKNTFRLYLAADVSWQGIKPIFYLKEEVEVDLSVNLSARGTVLSSASGEKSKIKTTEELAEINIPIGGIVQPIFKLYVPIEANLNAKFDIGFGIKATYGVEYSLENGGRIIDDLDKSFDDQSKVEGEFDLRVGFKASIGVEVLKIVEIKLGGEAGFKTIISIDAESHLGENVVSKHMCALCLDGVLDFYVKASIDVDVDIEIFGFDLITGNLIHYAPLEYTLTLGSCYFSLINSSNSIHNGNETFGWGTCPNIAWKTTFIVKNSSDTTTNDLVNVHNNRSDSVSLVCTGNSVFSEFLYNGSYIAKSTIDGTEYTQTFRVDDAPQTVTIKASNGGSSTDPDQPGEDDPIIPIPPVEEGKILHVNFVDSTTNLPIVLSDIFHENAKIGLGRYTTDEQIPEISTAVFEVAEPSDTKIIIRNIPELEAGGWDNYQLYFDQTEVLYELPETSDYPYTISSSELTQDVSGNYVVTLKLAKHYIKVENIVVTEANAADILGDGTAKYDYSTKTLTLTNAVLCENGEYENIAPIESNISMLILNIPQGTTSYLHSSKAQALNSKDISITGKGTLYICSDPDHYAIGKWGYYYDINIQNTTVIFDGASGGIVCETFTTDKATVKNTGIYNYSEFLNASSINISNSTIDITSLGSNIIWAHGDINIRNSDITLYGISDELFYGYFLFAEVATIYIDNASAINLVAPHASTDEDLELLCATKGIVLESGLTIRNSSGKACEIYQPGEGRNYSVRCIDGTYPNQIFVAASSEPIPTIRTIALPDAITITDVDYTWSVRVSGGGGTFKLNGDFELLSQYRPTVTTSWGDPVTLKNVSGKKYEFSIDVWNTWYNSDMDYGDTMGKIIITTGNKSKEITVTVNDTFDVSFSY